MGRAPCCDKNGLKKGPWTTEEDQKLIDYIQKHGYGNWRTLPKNAGLQRCGKSCRLRWTNYLRPDIKRGRFSFEEEETIIQLHSILGNKWSAIAARLPGRTDNEIKNYWNTHIRKRLLRMGIDPVTHSPRLDLVDLSSILNSSLYASYHHHLHQMNMSGLLGGIQQQPFVNPEILRIATSLLSSQRENQQQNLVLQSNGQQNQLCGPQVQSQNQPLVQANQFQSQVHQEIPTCTALTSTTPPCSTTRTVVPFSNAAQLMVHPNVEEYPCGMTNFSSQNSELTHDQYWQSNTSGIASNFAENDFVPLSPCYDNYYGSDQANIMDPSSMSETNSTFISNENFSFASVLSPSSSSPTPLTSKSTTYNINSSSTTTTEDESYCSNILKFDIPDIPDIPDVSNFM